MAARVKYCELTLSADTALPRNLTGMVIVSDYTSDGQRHLFLKRHVAEESKPAAAAPKRRRARKPSQALVDRAQPNMFPPATAKEA